MLARKKSRGGARAALETLEARRLMHAALDVRVNFQPEGAVVPAGYLADTGAAFGNRGNGFTYGWNLNNAGSARDRNVHADQRYDTLTHTQLYGERSWEIALANGQYAVQLVAGDPSYFGSTFKFNLEGTAALSGISTTAARFVESTTIVNVMDGRLTLSNAVGASNNKIAFLQISSYHSQPVVHVSASDASAAEQNVDAGKFTVTRTGDTAAAMTVKYALSGTATNGADYQPIASSIVISAGAASAVIEVKPIDDASVEAAETVVLTVLSDAAYELGTGTSAIVSIADNDSPPPPPAPSSVKVNFQPAGMAIPAGYLADVGGVFATRGNGFSYGWNIDNAGSARDRNVRTDQRYDTLTHTQLYGERNWEIALASGTYSVRLVAGDPSYFGSSFKFNLEGTLALSGAQSSATPYLESTTVVTVSDGRLTLSNAAGASNNKICFIEIAPATGPALPVVSVSVPNPSASETTGRSFVVSRAGDLSKALTVGLAISGSASSGGDYQPIASFVTISAGAASAMVAVDPLNDSVPEASETVVLTLAPGSEYSVGTPASETITIADDDASSGNTIAWTTQASSPIVRSEALKAVVDGKVYVLGGFSGSLGSVARSDVYDPLTNTWTRIADLPRRLTHAGVAVDGRHIYVAGGYVGLGTTGYSQQFGTREVWRFNVDTQQWSAFTQLPRALASGGLAIIGRTLHYFGGNDSTRSDAGDHYAIDLDNSGATWQTLVALPDPRSHFGTVVLNNRIYVIGGQHGNDSALVTRNAVHVWDPTDPGVWATAASLPVAIGHISSSTFVMGGRIIVAGGELSHGTATNQVRAYDPVTNGWTSMSSLPSARVSGVVDFLNGAIYFTTGSSQATTWRGVVS